MLKLSKFSEKMLNNFVFLHLLFNIHKVIFSWHKFTQEILSRWIMTKGFRWDAYYKIIDRMMFENTTSFFGRGGGRATPCGIQDLSSPTRDRARVSPALGVWSLNHWTAREVPKTLHLVWEVELENLPLDNSCS